MVAAALIHVGMSPQAACRCHRRGRNQQPDREADQHAAACSALDAPVLDQGTYTPDS
jgi:hypothetical protein